ncbi:Hypothetical predicted protein, partial [Lynx pardinus]
VTQGLLQEERGCCSQTWTEPTWEGEQISQGACPGSPARQWWHLEKRPWIPQGNAGGHPLLCR